MNHKAKITYSIIGLILLVILILGGLFLWQIKIPINSNVKQTVIIEEGDSLNIVASKLSSKGVIRSGLFFRTYMFISKKHQKIMPGLYQFSTNQNMISIANDLVSGKAADNKTTIIEGWRAEQIAGLLSKKDFNGQDFLTEIKDIKKYQAKFPYLKSFNQISTLEGFLFPDTYQFIPDESIESILSKMLTNFETKVFNKLDFKSAGKFSNLDDYLKLASIIEREIAKSEDRPKVAGLYYNRLRLQMKLDADPTVQYQKETTNPPKDYQDYWQKITSDDYYKWEGNYNTYIITGLPENPICNPGFDAVNSVLNPESNDHYYFFNTKDGKTIFSSSLEEHEENQKKYL